MNGDGNLLHCRWLTLPQKQRTIYLGGATYTTTSTREPNWELRERRTSGPKTCRGIPGIALDRASIHKRESIIKMMKTICTKLATNSLSFGTRGCDIRTTSPEWRGWRQYSSLVNQSTREKWHGYQVMSDQNKGGHERLSKHSNNNKDLQLLENPRWWWTLSDRNAKGMH